MPDEQQNTTEATETQQQASETPANFDAWIGAQPEPIKALYTQHVTGLQNTVKATREERNQLEKQIRDLSAKAEKGSELEKSLAEMQVSLEQANRKADFFVEAAKPEIGCTNSEVAFLLAVSKNLFDRRGAPDWAAIKSAAPELFGRPTVNANAGAGTQQQPPKMGMNDLIKRAAGRG